MLINVADRSGFPSERALIDAISARHRVLHYDGAGFGLSGEIPEAFDLFRLLGDCRTLADAAGLGRFAFLSESGRILGGGPAPPPDPIRGLIEEGWNASGSGLALAVQLSYFPEGPLDLLQALSKGEQPAATEAMVLALRDAVNTDSVAEVLPRVQCPTLIFQGRDNAVHPLSEAQKLATGIPDAELVVLDTANHVPLPGIAVYDGFVDTLLRFLAE